MAQVLGVSVLPCSRLAVCSCLITPYLLSTLQRFAVLLGLVCALSCAWCSLSLGTVPHATAFVLFFFLSCRMACGDFLRTVTNSILSLVGALSAIDSLHCFGLFVVWVCSHSIGFVEAVRCPLALVVVVLSLADCVRSLACALLKL